MTALPETPGFSKVGGPGTLFAQRPGPNQTMLEHRMADAANKTCSRCKKEKTRSEFSPDKRARDGLQSACCKCCTAAKKAARDANLEEYRAKERAYIHRNKERVYANIAASRARRIDKVKATKKAHYERIKDTPEFIAKRDAYARANRVRKSAYDREYRQRDPEGCLERSRRWREANPEKRKAIVRSYKARRRAQTEGGISTRALAEWTAKQPKICAWCDDDCSEAFHIDHIIPLSRGGEHEADNLTIACPSCNLKKGAKMPDEFLEAQAA